MMVVYAAHVQQEEVVVCWRIFASASICSLALCVEEKPHMGLKRRQTEAIEFLPNGHAIALQKYTRKYLDRQFFSDLFLVSFSCFFFIAFFLLLEHSNAF